MNLYIVNSSPSPQALDTAYASLLFKEKELIRDPGSDRSSLKFQFKSAPNVLARERLNQQILNLRVLAG